MKKICKVKEPKKVLCIVIPGFVIGLLLKFGIYYFRSDGFSGMSMLMPLLLFGTILFAIATSGFFAGWVYADSRQRHDDADLWAVIVFFTTPFIGMILYLLRRKEIKQNCIVCGHPISLTANYCENCGSPVETKEVSTMKQKTHHLQYIIAGTLCMILMLMCLVGFIVSAASGNVNSSPGSNAKVWNMGVIHMSVENSLGNDWKLRFSSASDGFVKESKMKIKDPETAILSADIKCETVPEDASLILWIVQGQKSESMDVTNLEEPLKYPLDNFESGKVKIRLQINGVEDVRSEIEIK